ncbi:MAG TPA: hypothetical protein VKB78_14495 [Pirellulales bacterium]|nr:hypothetical protein [Pirellulales bacterium]
MQRSPADGAARLVPDLGSGLFAVRETATNRLMKMPIEVKPVLEAACKDADPEIRTRARRILAHVIDADFQRRLALFAEDENDSKHYELPGWSRFRKLAGSDRNARDLFIEIQRAESPLMESLDLGRDAAARALERRLQQTAFSGRYGSGGMPPLGTIAALLYVGSDKEVALSEDDALGICELLYQPSFRQSLAMGKQSEQLKTILAAWIARDAGPNVTVRNLSLAVQFNLKEGLEPAVHLLAQPGLIPDYKVAALLTIAKFGGKGELPLVDPYLDSSVVIRPTDVNGIVYVTELRDVALFASIRLAAQEPKQFGFTRMGTNDQFFYQIANMGFRSSADRDEAFRKWNAWRSANLPSREAAKTAANKS